MINFETTKTVHSVSENLFIMFKVYLEVTSANPCFILEIFIPLNSKLLIPRWGLEHKTDYILEYIIRIINHVD